MPRRENSLPAPPSGKVHRPVQARPLQIHPRRQHDSRRDVAWRVSTRAPKCYNTQPEHLRAQANLGVSFLGTQNRVNRPCSALICKRKFAHGFQTIHDFKGIKTWHGSCLQVTSVFQTSPDFKGIKTSHRHN